MLRYLIGELFYRWHGTESPHPASTVHKRTLILINGYAEIGDRILNMLWPKKGTLLVHEMSLFLKSPRNLRVRRAVQGHIRNLVMYTVCLIDSVSISLIIKNAIFSSIGGY